MAFQDADRPVLIIMAKSPQPGRCKTRLAGRLGLRGAARLQRRLLRRSCALASQCGHRVELHVDPDLSHPAILSARRAGLVTRRQVTGDLGRRMCVAQGRRAAVIIGTDCPALQPALITRALAAVAQGHFLCVPALDGGYVLIGLPQPYPAGFRAIEWGSSKVLAQYRRQQRASGRPLQQWQALPDLDDACDFWRERRSGRLGAY